MRPRLPTSDPRTERRREQYRRSKRNAKLKAKGLPPEAKPERVGPITVIHDGRPILILPDGRRVYG